MSNIVYSNVKAEVNITGSYFPIPRVTAIEPPKVSRAEIEISSMDSVGNKEFVGERLFDPGAVTMKYFLDDTSTVHQYIESRSFAGQAVDLFKLTFSNGKVWSFSGSFLEYAVTDVGPNSVLSVDTSIRIVGSIVRA